MNAITPLVPNMVEMQRRDALCLWNQRRSKLIDMFAKSEFAVTETLQFLSSTEGRVGVIKIKPTLQARFVQLMKLVDIGGAFSAEGKSVLAPLHIMNDHIDLRNLLCHGHETIYISDNGCWIAKVEMLTIVKGSAETREALLTDTTILDKQREIHQACSRLNNQLRQLRDRLSAGTNLTPSAQAAQGSR